MKLTEPYKKQTAGYLRHITKPKETNYTETIINYCLRLCGVTRRQFDSKSRKREIVFCRQLAMTLLFRHSVFQLTTIGRLCNNRDHATVLHAIRKIIYCLEYNYPEIELVKRAFNYFADLLPVQKRWEEKYIKCA